MRMSWEEVTLGPCRLICADAGDVLATLGQLDALVTDPPYGVGFAGKRGHYRHHPNAKRVDTYQGYDDTPANFAQRILPRLRQALRLVTCGAVFAAGHTLFTLPPGWLGGFYLPNGCGVGPWGFQNFMHVLFYGKDPYLAAGLGSRP